MAKAQNDQILKHLQAGNSITPLKAIGNYGVFRLAARIHDLRKRGFNIATDLRIDPQGKKYASYYLIKP